MSIADRIKSRRSELGFTLLEISEQLGVSEATVQRYESGNIKNLKSSTISRLAIILQTTPTYLMGWEDEPDTEVTSKQLTLIGHKTLRQIGTQKVPLLGRIAAGQPIFAQEDFECYVEIGANIKCDFCLRVKGDSMINARIHDGDIVFIRAQSDVEDGEIAAVLIEDEATLKRVYKNGTSINLVAENPKYKPIICTEQDGLNVIILGKAVAFQSDIR